jgi:GDP-L-fucose synthase
MSLLRGKIVLVTGGAGFLGAKIVQQLEQRNPADILIPRSWDWNLTDQQDTRLLLEEAQPDVIIHAAAEVGGIGANMENPGRFLYANAMMGLNVIEQARVVGVEKIVVVGTVCSYPKYAKPPFIEEQMWAGYPEETNAPYGVAKKMLLVQAEAYHQQYGMNIPYVIPTNLYGPGDNINPGSSHAIPAIMRKCIEAIRNDESTVSLWGTGAASREFLYVDDAAEGIVRAAERNVPTCPINLGAGQEITIAEVARKIAEVTGFTGNFAWDKDKPDGQPRRSVNAQRAKDLLGWEPKISLAEGLDRTYRWIKKEF